MNVHPIVRTALLTFVFVATGCQQTTQPPVAVETQSQAIVNGTRDPMAVELTEAQVLAVGWLYPNGDPSNNFCTGTLISERVVATAQHCVAGSSGNDVGFGMGTMPNDPDAAILATEIYTHPSVDAALIVLSRDATEEIDVEPIPANSESIPDSLIGEPVQAGGYGQTYDRNRFGRWFATVYLDSVDSSQIHVDGRGEQGICYGDSGGPAIAPLGDDGAPVLLAVESWGDGSCVDNDHMTRLDVLYDGWIEPILNGDVPEDPCDGLDFLGRCNENVAEWCDRGTLQTRDCTALGTTCEYIDDRVGFICGCGDLGFLGRCDGDVAEYCDDGRFAQVNCQVRGLSCGWVDDDIGYFCTDDPGCTAEDEQGRCDGDVAINCVDSFTTRQDCSFTDEVCFAGDSGAECIEDGEQPTGDEILDAGLGDVDIGSGGSDVTVVGSESSSQDSGCGCAAVGESRGAPPAWVLLALVGLTVRRRGVVAGC